MEEEKNTPTQTAEELKPSGAAGVGLAGIVVAAAGYIVLFIAARTLSLEDNTQFLTFWALLFALIGITGGLANETTRAVRAGLLPTATQAPDAADVSRPRVVRVGLGIGALLAVAILATAPLWGARILPQDTVLGVAFVALAVFLFSGHASVTGALAGMGRWALYARVVSLESVVRLTVVVVVAIVSASLVGFMVTSAVATGAWLIAAGVSARTRQTLDVRADRPLRKYVSGIGYAMIASLSTAALVVGYPVLIRLTTPDDVYVAAAPLLMAISLTRAPLLLPLNAFQGVAITHFIENADRRAATLIKVVGVILGVGVVGAGLAALLGPWLLKVMLGEDYIVSSALLAGLTMAGALLALVTLTGTAVLALGRHAHYSAGWAAASIVALLILLLPIALEERVVISLCVGPLVGVAVHGWALVRARAPRSVG